MGIDTQAWRQRIGSFSQSVPSRHGTVHLSGLACYSRVAPRLACIIAVLLAVSGIEPNPGPGPGPGAVKLEDIARRLDDVFNELRDLRASLSTKIDDCVHELRTCEARVTAQAARLDAVEKTLADNAAQLAALHTSTANQAIAITTAPPTPMAASSISVTMGDIMRELNMRASKKANIILSGVKASLQADTEIVTNLLHDELGITTTVTRCIRLGKTPAAADKPRLLLATLSSDSDATAAIRSARNLRNSSNDYVRGSVYINADLTPEQRKLDSSLRAELKRRRSAGEPDLVIRNGRVQSKHSSGNT